MQILKRFYDTVVVYAGWFQIKRKSINKKSNKIEKRTKSILILAWTFPPTVSGGVFRPVSIARYAVEMGWDVTVICGPMEPDPTLAGIDLLNRLPREVKIFRTETRLNPINRLMPRVDGGFVNVINVVKKAIAAFGNYSPAFIIASGPPFHNFIAAYYLADCLASDLVLDYRDEWSECPLGFVEIGRFGRIWEKKCLQRADKVIFTADGHHKHSISKFPNNDHRKYKVIRNGWEPDEFAPRTSSNIPVKSGAKICVTYTGSIGGYNLPNSFLDLIKIIFERRKDIKKRFVFKFVGKKVNEAEQQLNQFPYQENIENISLVPKMEANKIMKAAAALLIINAPIMDRCVSGKLYEYLASGTPIISLGITGEASNIIKELGAGFLVPFGDDKSLENALDQLLNNNNTNFNNKKVEEWLINNTRKKLTQDLIAFITTQNQCPDHND